MPRILKQSARVAQARGARLSVVDRISPIEFGTDDGLKMLVYGRSATGKTTFWSSWPKPILAIICSGGSRPGELRSVDTPELRKVLKTVTLEDSSEIRDVAEHVKSSGTYKTVVLDHVSGLQDIVLKEILGLKEIPVQKSWGLATQQQYGQCTVQCKELLRCLLDLVQNVVLVAQEREFNSESESDLILPTVGAGLTPALTNWLNAAVDYIGQTFLRQKEVLQENTVNGKVVKRRVKIKGVEYCLRTAPDAVYTTKFRVPKGRPLPDAIVDPDYTEIRRIIKGE